MNKPNITRTLGQIHFEDLEPHRFEDLVRQLIYDYKDWQSIEATGRGGADDGYDIRAYERNNSTPVETDEETESMPPMDGRQWMIQCKREKEVGAAKVKKIILEGVNPNDPPYGYILATAANISKKTYDAFREELRRVGVMEFYIWGKAELEDLLLLPKNDRILFTFFGISLVTKRQSKTTELRSQIAIKNKLIALLGSNAIYQRVLIRDLNDEFYPYGDEDPNFDTKPGWKSYTAFEYDPLGIWCHVSEYFGYIDKENKEYDFISSHDFVVDDDNNFQSNQLRHKNQMLLRKHWELLPKHHQIHIKREGLLKFKDVVLIDPKGDSVYEMPQLFVDYLGKPGPFDRIAEGFEIGREWHSLKDFKRISFFPMHFEELQFGEVHHDLVIEIDKSTMELFEGRNSVPALYCVNNKYSHLKSKDVVFLKCNGEDKTQWMVTSIYACTLTEHLGHYQDVPSLTEIVLAQLKKPVGEQRKMKVFEIRRIYG